jgi:hypothetical protein
MKRHDVYVMNRAVTALYERRNLLRGKTAVIDRRYKEARLHHYPEGLGKRLWGRCPRLFNLSPAGIEEGYSHRVLPQPFYPETGSGSV